MSASKTRSIISILFNYLRAHCAFSPLRFLHFLFFLFFYLSPFSLISFLFIFSSFFYSARLNFSVDLLCLLPCHPHPFLPSPFFPFYESPIALWCKWKAKQQCVWMWYVLKYCKKFLRFFCVWFYILLLILLLIIDDGNIVKIFNLWEYDMSSKIIFGFSPFLHRRHFANSMYKYI